MLLGIPVLMVSSDEDEKQDGISDDDADISDDDDDDDDDDDCESSIMLTLRCLRGRVLVNPIPCFFCCLRMEGIVRL